MPWNILGNIQAHRRALRTTALKLWCYFTPRNTHNVLIMYVLDVTMAIYNLFIAIFPPICKIVQSNSLNKFVKS